MAQSTRVSISSSPFKNITAQPWKIPYQDLQLSSLTTESWGMSCSATHLAYTQQAQTGIVSVLALPDVGRVPPILRLCGHKGAIQDIHFHQFDDRILASAGDDSAVKVWKLPDKSTWKSDSPKPETTLSGHIKKVFFIKWNPTANNILASGATDPSVAIWDIEASKMTTSVAQPSVVLGLAWNLQGSLLSCVGKDKKACIIDPRANKTLFEFHVHDGAKSSKTVWLDGQKGDSNTIVTTGFTKTAGREIKVWDIRNTNQPTQDIMIDPGSGYLLPHWEESTGLFFIVSKGEGYIRPYVYEKGTLIKLSDFRDRTSQRALTFLPARCVDVTKNEIVRVFKGDETGTSINPISFFIKRKEVKFHEDLYPPCMNGTAAMTAIQWLSGKNSDPLRSNFTANGLSGNLTEADAKGIKPKAMSISKSSETRPSGKVNESATTTSVTTKKLEVKKAAPATPATTNLSEVKKSDKPRTIGEIKKKPKADSSVQFKVLTKAATSKLSDDNQQPTKFVKQVATTSPLNQSRQHNPSLVPSSTDNASLHKPKGARKKLKSPTSVSQGRSNAAKPAASDNDVSKVSTNKKRDNKLPPTSPRASALDFSQLEEQIHHAKAITTSLAKLIEDSNMTLNRAKAEHQRAAGEAKQLDIQWESFVQ